MLYQTTCLVSNAVPTDSSVDDHEQVFVIRRMYRMEWNAYERDTGTYVAAVPCMGRL